ncbi:chondroitin sulfate glucuronyltransferase-like [Patiria miniata]|uniref:Hexosyltransferase n=1 Tax=Patiria miniata TaxID=46514 RepID=A0A913Z911_PATMI|nr:chondroitin sulfate glucuronyltransferase-like [Patiria miniata]
MAVMSRSRTVIYIALGICAGALLSMLCVPLETGCGVDSYVHVGTKRKTSAVDMIDYGTDENGNQLNDEDFEPVLMTVNRPVVKKDIDRQRLIRMRYISSELSIKEKLFVGVMVSREEIDLESTTVGINKTLSHYVSKLVFFTKTNSEQSLSGMTIIAFPGEQVNVRMFQIWKYIYEHHGSDYDWFLVIQDDTYIYGDVFMEFLGHMSVGRDLYMGIPIHEAEMDVTFCSRDAGYMLSRNLLAKVGPYWEDCMRKSWNNVPDLEFGRCIQDHSNSHCSTNYEGSTFYAYDFEDKVLTDKEKNDADFQQALAIHHVMDTRTMYKLHKYFSERSLSQTLKQIAELQQNIEEISAYAPGGKSKLTWPVGVQGPFKTTSRFDVMGWEYFSMTHLYGLDDYEPKSPLIGANKQDIDEILTTTMARLNELHGNIYMLGRLVNGYRRFDPNRGMEYTLDMELKLHGDKREILKRVHLLRPLNKVEIVFMPYVTEYTQVTIIVPVVSGSQEQVRVFLDNYARICLETRDKSAVMLIFVYTPTEAMTMATEDIYSANKGYVSYLERKYPGSHLSWISVKTSLPSPIAIMDVVSKKFASDTLFLFTNANMEIAAEFLNRVRMNTIAGWQVFFPIPFSQYDPKIIYADLPNPNRIDISKTAGHFDTYLFEHASFYNSDYMNARKLWDEKHPGSETDHIQSDLDLFEMFLSTKLHTFRAVDPALKLHYHQRICQPSLKEEQYQRCLEGRAVGLASKAQLAMLVLEQQQKLAAEKGNI